MTTTDKVKDAISGGAKLISDNAAMVQYKTLTDQEIKLTPALIRKYLVNGEGLVTDQEVMMFMSLCKYQKLNPFLREAYLIKYGSEKATMVVGKETFLKRAMKNPKYKGHEVGISDDGKKAWAKVYVDGYNVPITCEVDYDEYVGKKRDGTINSIWKSKPKTMMKKVALLQSLREAFPEDLGGMYGQEEISHIQELPTQEVKVEEDIPVFTPPTAYPTDTWNAPTTAERMDAVQPITEADIEEDKKESGNTVRGLVSKITKKEGKGSNGKPYVKHHIQINDIDLTTFSNTVTKDAQAAMDAELLVVAEFEVNGTYKNIKTLKSCVATSAKEAERDWQKEFEEAPDSSYLDELWAEFEATNPNGAMIVKMRRINDRKRSAWKEGK